MEWITRWRKRLRVLLRREEVERELDEELAFHLEMETRTNLRAGMTPEAARRQAVLTFGGRERFREEVRDARWFAPVIGLTLDMKLALRMLAKHPALSVTGALGMAVGVAIATGFFSFMAFYYSAPPLDEGDRIVGVDYLDMGNEDCFCTTLFDLETWRGSQRSVGQLSAFRDSHRYVRVPGGTTGGVRVAEMTASGFDVARVPPLLGRPLLESDEAEGAPAVLVIGHDEWRRDFGADRGIVGREVRLDGAPYTVVGVMPEGFRFPYNHGYWTALRSDAALDGPGEGPRVTIFGRLALRGSQGGGRSRVESREQRGSRASSPRRTPPYARSSDRTLRSCSTCTSTRPGSSGRCSSSRLWFSPRSRSPWRHWSTPERHLARPRSRCARRWARAAGASSRNCSWRRSRSPRLQR